MTAIMGKAGGQDSGDESWPVFSRETRISRVACFAPFLLLPILYVATGTGDCNAYNAKHPDDTTGECRNIHPRNWPGVCTGIQYKHRGEWKFGQDFTEVRIIFYLVLGLGMTWLKWRIRGSKWVFLNLLYWLICVLLKPDGFVHSTASICVMNMFAMENWLLWLPKPERRLKFHCIALLYWCLVPAYGLWYMTIKVYYGFIEFVFLGLPHMLIVASTPASVKLYGAKDRQFKIEVTVVVGTHLLLLAVLLPAFMM